VFSRFFIDRPIFASVLSIVIVLAGAVAYTTLPLAQYPQITPPTIQVSCNYPGASARVVAEAVAAPIEQQVNGVENMLYMSSQCTNDGSYNLTVTFKPGVNLNFAQVLVQNRVNLALPLLPDVVKQTGITTRKRSPDILLVVSLYSEEDTSAWSDEARDRLNLYLSNYATLQVKEELARVEGVGDVFLFGQQDYSMRVWLDPEKLSARNLTAGDVVAALRQQNSQVATGQIGQPPAAADQQMQLTLSTKGRLAQVEEFEDVILRVLPGGQKIRIRDVTRSRYVLRIDLAADRLKKHDLRVDEVDAALATQGVRLGALPGRPRATLRVPGGAEAGAARLAAPTGLPFRATVNQPHPPTESELGALPIRPSPEGVPVVLKDLVVPGGIRRERDRDEAGVELAAKNMDIIARLDGRPTVGIAIFQLPDANALDTAVRVRQKMEELKQNFPPGVNYNTAYDTTPFVDESMKEVFHTLRDAIILVAVVVLVFLQNWRSAIIPLVAVPVAIVGTFAVMAAIGFSLNNLTLFGLVLAIGIVVDDAIVVVEAVEHHMEHGLGPRDATLKAMDEVSGPVVAVALVLSAVFLPCAFIPGITGAFYRQFALTIAVSTVISAFNSLTLSPALAAILLRPKSARKDLPGRALDLVLGWFFRLFNFGFRHTTGAYGWLVGRALRASVLVLVLYAGLLGLTYVGFRGVPREVLPPPDSPWRLGRVVVDRTTRVGSFALASGIPTGYIPTQDKGYLIVAVQLPDSASLERTREVIARIDRMCLGDEELGGKYHGPKPPPGSKLYQPFPGVGDTISISGQSFVLGAYGPNFGNLFVPLAPFHERRDPELNSDVIAAKLRALIADEVPDALVFIFGPPPVSGLGTAGGFKVLLEDRGDLGLEELQKQSSNFIRKANEHPKLAGLTTVFRNDSPQLFVDVNREQCYKMGVALQDVFTTLQVYLGSLYVNDFNLFGRTWQVIVQAEGPFRNEVEDVRRLKVRNNRGGMVPLGSLCDVKEITGPLILTRYNMYPAAAINGNTAAGVSSGEAIDVVARLARQEAPALTHEWTEIIFIQLLAGNTATYLFLAAVLFVFLVLAAQYESWTLPLAVILVVPMCLLGSLVGVALTSSDVNIFVQIGFVVLIGLACKNAILIVEFAKVQREAGRSSAEATLEACKLRLRPILMTSFAFILGVVPLVIGRGAGAEMRRSLGTAVFGGMIGVTLFGIFLTPVFFYVIDRLGSLPVFQTPSMRMTGLVLLHILGVLTLGLSWLLVLLFRELRRRERPAAAAAIAPLPPPAPPPGDNPGREEAK
jgi:multidrug efflux pump subunit AcrB